MATTSQNTNQATEPRPSVEVATLAGGCFWCLEAVYDQAQGVEQRRSRLRRRRGGEPDLPAGLRRDTGHAEVVQVTFDPQVISFAELLEIFFTIHDPTTLNRQGADVGTQYRSAIFYHSPEQKATAEQVIAEIWTRLGIWDGPIVTEVAPLHGLLPGRGLPSGILRAQQRASPTARS